MSHWPARVDEVTTRVVAGEVLALTALTLATDRPWLLPALAADFTARAAAGPAASPLARLARGIRPRVGGEPRWVAAPPKRFATAIGAGLTLAATAARFTGRRREARALTVLMVVFPALEAGLGLCVGCRLFDLGMRLGLVPDDVCAACADVSLRTGTDGVSSPVSDGVCARVSDPGGSPDRRTAPSPTAGPART